MVQDAENEHSLGGGKANFARNIGKSWAYRFDFGIVRIATFIAGCLRLIATVAGVIQGGSKTEPNHPEEESHGYIDPQGYVYWAKSHGYTVPQGNVYWA